jgi:hypothetical protein
LNNLVSFETKLSSQDLRKGRSGKWLIAAGLSLVVMCLGLGAVYRNTGAAPAQGSSLVELSAEPVARPVIRLEGLSEVGQVRTPSWIEVPATPSEAARSDEAGLTEEPL